MKTWNAWFYIPYLAALAAGIFILKNFEKGQDVLFLNQMHHPALDVLFAYGTFLGDGLMYLIVVAVLVFFSYRKAFVALICFAITGLVVQVLKRIVFPEIYRPSVFLSGYELHFVEGVKILSRYSFPSGHSAMAFSLFSLLSQLVKPRWYGLIFICLALIGGISRIYLVQHFFIDVYFGSLIGVAVTTIVWMVCLQHADTPPRFLRGSLRDALFKPYEV
ncbi:MAG: phosphatase PAP2 family protein [Chitinophagales bacterium]|nr:MAG: phosphatase PAP2 family protein [Chitinophagales bacterium]